MRRSNTIADFWGRVDIRNSDECWEWQGGRNQKGYGKFYLESGKMYAHRFAWTITNGDIPPGTVVRHTCDNPPCCNPAHLELGTHADNMRDAVERGRIARGSRQGKAILGEGDVTEIWRLLSEKKTQAEVAATYGVGRKAINDIATGKSWSWLTGEKTSNG